MSPWWLLLIIPASASFGAFLMGILASGKQEDRKAGLEHD